MHPIRRPTALPPLARLLLLALALGACVPSVLGRRDAYRDVEARLHELVNRHRAERGLPPLVHDPAVAAIARAHSRRMAMGRVPFGHRGFQARAREVRAFRPSGWISENVAVNTFDRRASPAMALKGLAGSRKHRRNLEGPFAATGIGVARGRNGSYYYTQLFVH